jgi:hypothetical protein
MLVWDWSTSAPEAFCDGGWQERACLFVSAECFRNFIKCIEEHNAL